MRSMTGFGRAVACADGREIIIELKTVNHRILDINMRLPRSLTFLEDTIRTTLRGKLSRGHVEVWITYNNTRQDAKCVNLDEGLLSAYLKAFEKIRDTYEIRDDISVSTVAKLPDVLTVTEAEEDTEAIEELTRAATEQAADALNVMRENEGARLLKDVSEHIDAVEVRLREIEKKAPLVVEEYKQKLKKRITELMEGAEPDESRFNQEVAFFADKCAIDEETVRLDGHIKHMRETFTAEAAVGRQMDFLVQEMNRETNTIGSKAQDMDILNNVVAIKSEIEKIREQIQNIE